METVEDVLPENSIETPPVTTHTLKEHNMAFMKSARITLASLSVLCLGTIAAPAANAYSPDIDGDGIPNTWEMKGYDADGDGKIDVDFPAMGADPNHKDIFVEMDYMAGLLPSEDELDRITKIYADLPVRNPNGTTGVNIHLDAGSARSAKYNLGGGNEISYQELDSEFKALHRIKATEGKFNPAREGTFHYVIWGDYYDNGTSSGIANFGGRNLMVTVGPHFWGKASSDIRVAVFVHELGHNLALSHGGWDEINYKPNYYSVMNYQYTLTGVPMADGSRYFGYSTAEYRMLNEAKLYEARGFGPRAAGFLYKGKPANQPIDFNSNGKIDTEPVSVDLNGDGMITNLGAANDMKVLRFQATENPEKGKGPEHIEPSGITAEHARSLGLIK